MTKVLILTGRYLPGYKDGGPVRSIENLVWWLGDEYDIHIMCLDRDHGDEVAYPDIKVDAWNEVGKAKVYYVEGFNARKILGIAKEMDIVYCCGPYSDYAICAMRLKKNGHIKVPLVVASMGSFSPDAFALKGKKKEIFVKLMKALGMFNKVIWSVTSIREENELKDIIGDNAKCLIAEDLPREGVTKHTGSKRENHLNIIFLSRISRKKNLSYIPQVLEKLDKELSVSVDIYGVDEDKDYLEECRLLFDKLPSNITWDYKGEVASSEVPNVFAKYDAFLFPTLGENYGHVIAESLAAGCVPIISDRTPWLDFEDNICGYVIPLEEKDRYLEAISNLARKTPEEYGDFTNNCYTYIDKVNKNSVENSGYKKIFSLV